MCRIEDWKDNALGVANSFLTEPLKLNVKNVAGGGDQAWAFLELEANGKCKNGQFKVGSGCAPPFLQNLGGQC